MNAPKPKVSLEATLAASTTAATDLPLDEIVETSTLRIGRYLVLGQLGVGGMGVVYGAYDPELDRKVALKLLRPGRAGMEERARLAREAQALARLSHPNVVSVHDVGTTDDGVFITMEFVEGTTLREWVAESERPWREVVEVFIQAGRGLAAAHDVGLIHRDFKPENVMISATGEVKVTDFGLARATEDAAETHDLSVRDSISLTSSRNSFNLALTQIGSMVGTPAYMAPEQFRGIAVDARADQFSFCVALHEALFGMRPFRGESLDELSRNVVLGRKLPAPPERSVPAHVRAVLDRGLKVSPKRRWPDMHAALEALSHDPWVRRRRLAVVGGLALATTGGGLGVASLLGAEAPCQGSAAQLEGVWDDDRRAQVRGAIAGSGLSYAADTATRVEQMLDLYTDEWVKSRVAACEATHVHHEQSAALMDTRMACLDRRRGELAALVEVLAGSDSGAVENAATAVSELPGVEPCADFDQLTAEIPLPDDSRVAAEVEALRQRLARVKALQKTGAGAEAIALSIELQDAAERIGYAPLRSEVDLWAGRLRLGREETDEAVRLMEQAYFSAESVGATEMAQDAAIQLVRTVGYEASRYDDAMRWSRHAEAKTEHRGDTLARARLLDALSVVHQHHGKLEEALAHSQQALELQRERLPADHPRIASTLLHLGLVQEGLGTYDEAVANMQRFQAITEASVGPDHPAVANALFNIGNVQVKQGDHGRALGSLTRALEIQEAAFGTEHSLIGSTANSIGKVHYLSGRYEEAAVSFERSLAIRELSLGPDHPHLASTLNNLGSIKLVQGKHVEARDLLERASAIWERTFGAEHPRFAASLINLSQIYLETGELDRGRAVAERSLALTRDALGPAHPQTAYAHSAVGAALVELDRQDEARTHLVAGLTGFEAVFGREHPELFSPLTELGRLELRAGRFSASSDYYLRAVVIKEAATGADHRELISPLSRLADALRSSGRGSEARAHAERAVRIAENGESEPSSSQRAMARFSLARVLWEQKVDRRRAVELARTARADLGADGNADTLAEIDEWLAKYGKVR